MLGQEMLQHPKKISVQSVYNFSCPKCPPPHRGANPLLPTVGLLLTPVPGLRKQGEGAAA